MSEGSVIIKHYKKQLIYRQKDKNLNQEDDRNHNETKNNVYDFQMEKDNDSNNKSDKRDRKVRKKRKNRNCRGQFRHEAMELIKLGTNNSASLCKNKEILIQNMSVDKTMNNKNDNCRSNNKRLDESTKKSSDNENSITFQGHSLPQMVPERRNSKELLNKIHSPPHSMAKSSSQTMTNQIASKPTYVREDARTLSTNNKIQTQMNQQQQQQQQQKHIDNNNNNHPYIERHYPPPSQSTLHNLLAKSYPPPPLQNKPTYSNHDNKNALVPPYPLLQHQNEQIYNNNASAPPYLRYQSKDQIIKSPPYPLNHPPHPPVNLNVYLSNLPQHSPRGLEKPPPPSYEQYKEFHAKKNALYQVQNRVNLPPPQPRHLPQPLPQENLKKRGEKRKQETTIELTNEHNNNNAKNKCKCECGKNYPVTTASPLLSTNSVQEIIIKLPKEFQNSSQVPIIKGKMINGVLEYETPKLAEKLTPICENGIVKAQATSVIKSKNDAALPIIRENHRPPQPNGKSSQMFLIENIITKDSDKYPSSQDDNTRSKDPVIRSRLVSPPVDISPGVISRSPGVIVSNKQSKVTKPSVTDFGVSTIITPSQPDLQLQRRRQSIEIDTISISSSSSNDSMKSPRPKSANQPQIPNGKLLYMPEKNCFMRYYDDKQKQMFIDNTSEDADPFGLKSNPNEMIQLPGLFAGFNEKDNLTVEEYVSELILVETLVPKDFFLFYKFVTGYQICNRHLPVSFLTFLKLYNTNGLKDLLERYIHSLNKRT